MKAYFYIPIIAVFSLLASCNSALYTGSGEYDDLYYSSSDESPADTRTSGNVAREGVLKSDQYFNNIYAADTLVSQEYADAVDIDNLNSSGDGTYDYYDDYSYASRLRRFHGNYFDPYWRDPFYYGMYSPFRYSFGMGFGYPHYGYSSFYDPYYYDPFYSDYYYGGFYSPYSYYSPYRYGYGYGYGLGYGYGYGYPNFRYVDADDLVTYGRRERQSTTSTRWNSMSGTGRRDSYISGQPSTERAGTSRRTAATTSASQVAVNPNDSRRTVSSSQEVKSAQAGSRQVQPRSSAGQRPEYGSANRTYTPSYNNPRMSTRPSYNNSRVPAESGQNPRYRTSSSVRAQDAAQPANRSVSSGTTRTVSPAYSGGSSASSSRRSSASYGGSQGGSYTVPSRRSAESSSSRSGSSYSGSSDRSYSGGGSSYSGGSSSSGSSYSGGGGSSSSRSSGSSSSGSRR